MTKLLTIYTPTFNRADILPELYKSLCQQTSRNFLWLVIDDGSTDNTAQVIETWKNEADFKIQYYLQPNGGKFRATNAALERCRTDLFCCVDSDDRLAFNAVERIEYYWQLYHNEKILGFISCRGDFNGNRKGENWPGRLDKVTHSALYQKYGFKGETMPIWKSEIIKQFRYPEYDNEKYIASSVLYDQMDHLFPCRLIPDVLCLFEYLPTGLTKQGVNKHIENPKGTAFYYQQRFGMKELSLTYRLRMGAKYLAWRKVFKLEDSMFSCLRGPILLRLASQVLSFKYEKEYLIQKDKVILKKKS